MNQPQRKVTLTSLTPKPTTYKAKAFCNNCDNVVEGDFEFAVPLYSSACPKCGCKHLTTMVAYRNSQREGASLTSVSRNAIYNSPGRQLVDVDFSGVETRVAAYLSENPGALRQAQDSHRPEFLAQYQQEPVRRSLLSEAGLRALRNAETPLVSAAARQRAADAQRQETRRLQREATRYDSLTDASLGIAWDPAWSREQQPSSSPTPDEIQAAIDSVSPYRLSGQTGRTSSMPTYEAAMADADAVTPADEEFTPEYADSVLDAIHLDDESADVAVQGTTAPRSIINIPLRQPDDPIRGIRVPPSLLPTEDVVDQDAIDAMIGATGFVSNMSIVGTPPDSPNPYLAAFHASEQFERRVDAAARRRGAANDALFNEMVQAIEESTGIGQRILNADSATGISNLSDDDLPVVIGDSSSTGETDDEEESEQEGGHTDEQAPDEQ